MPTNATTETVAASNLILPDIAIFIGHLAVLINQFCGPSSSWFQMLELTICASEGKTIVGLTYY
jgi:hypothetical protein